MTTWTVKVEFLSDGRRARVLEPYSFQTVSSRWAHLPEGFVTDFASVPRFFWRVLPPWGRYLRAAVCHDFLYYSGVTTRADADATFLAMMEGDGVSWWRRWAMYAAVRGFGGIPWRAHRGKEEKLKAHRRNLTKRTNKGE